MLLDENKTFPVSTTVRRETILKCKQPSGKVRVAKFTDVKRIVTGQQKNDLNFQSALNIRGIYIVSLQFMGNNITKSNYRRVCVVIIYFIVDQHLFVAIPYTIRNNFEPNQFSLLLST